MNKSFIVFYMTWDKYTLTISSPKTKNLSHKTRTSVSLSACLKKSSLSALWLWSSLRSYRPDPDWKLLSEDNLHFKYFSAEITYGASKVWWIGLRAVWIFSHKQELQCCMLFLCDNYEAKNIYIYSRRTKMDVSLLEGSNSQCSLHNVNYVS